MSLIFKISSDVTQIGDRIGLQVSFTNQTNPPDVYGEIRFAPVLFDSFYAMQQLVTSNWTGPTHYTTTTTSSTIHLPIINDSNPFASYAAVSFAYQELNIQTINYSPTYTWTNFFGEFAGMFGTLCGLDALKLLGGMRLIPKAWRKKKFWTYTRPF